MDNFCHNPDMCYHVIIKKKIVGPYESDGSPHFHRSQPYILSSYDKVY